MSQSRLTLPSILQEPPGSYGLCEAQLGAPTGSEREACALPSRAPELTHSQRGRWHRAQGTCVLFLGGFCAGGHFVHAAWCLCPGWPKSSLLAAALGLDCHSPSHARTSLLPPLFICRKERSRFRRPRGADY